MKEKNGREGSRRKRVELKPEDKLKSELTVQVGGNKNCIFLNGCHSQLLLSPLLKQSSDLLNEEKTTKQTEKPTTGLPVIWASGCSDNEQQSIFYKLTMNLSMLHVSVSADS